jgi:hypothetical protein
MANEERGVGTNRCFSKENIMSPKPFLPAWSVGGELRAYGREVRAWSNGLLMRYVVAVLLLLAALAGLIGAMAMGLGALFHFLEMKYGTLTTYESIGGLLIVLTIAAALGKLKEEMPAPPNPQRHAKAASRIAVAERHGSFGPSGRTLAARPVVPAAIGLASVGLSDWPIAARRNASKTHAFEPEKRLMRCRSNIP